jgi:hypothetical protein
MSWRNFAILLSWIPVFDAALTLLIAPALTRTLVPMDAFVGGRTDSIRLTSGSPIDDVSSPTAVMVATHAWYAHPGAHSASPMAHSI